MPSFIADAVSGVADVVSDVVGGVANAVGNVIEPVAAVASLVPGPWQIPAIAFNGINSLAHGNILGAVGSAFGYSQLGAAGGVVYDASGMAIDAASVASGATELAGGIAYNAAGQALGNAVDVASQMVSGGSGLFGGANGILPGESGGMPTGILGGTTFGIKNSTLGNIFKAGSSIYQALNAPGVQSPTAAQAGADPYAPYRPEASRMLSNLVSHPEMVYGLPGFNFAQDQGAKQIERANASTGNLASGSTLSSLQLQGAQTAQSWYNNYVNQLSMLSGAKESPLGGQTAYNAAQEATAKARDARQSALLEGLIGNQQSPGLIPSFFG